MSDSSVSDRLVNLRSSIDNNMRLSFTGSSFNTHIGYIAPSIMPFQPMLINWNLTPPVSIRPIRPIIPTQQPYVNDIYSSSDAGRNEIDPWKHIFNDSYPISSCCSNKIIKPIAKKKPQSPKPKMQQDTNKNNSELDDYLIQRNSKSIMNKLDQIAELLTTGIRTKTKQIKPTKKRTELLKTPDVYIEESNIPTTPIIYHEDEDEDEDEEGQGGEQAITRQEYFLREHEYMLQLQNYYASDNDSEGTVVEEDDISNSSDNYDSDDSLGSINSPPIARRTDSRQTIQKSNSRPSIQNNTNNRPIGIGLDAMEMYLPQFNVRSSDY